MLTFLFTALLFSEDISYLAILPPRLPIVTSQCDPANFSNYETWQVAQEIANQPMLTMQYKTLVEIIAKTEDQKENAMIDIVNRHIYLFDNISLYTVFWSELTQGICEIY